MEKPQKFCEFQTNYNLKSQAYHCLIGDWQCNRPLCSYKSKGGLSEKGCEIAKCEGELVKSMLGFSDAKPPEIASHFNIIIDVPGLKLDENSITGMLGQIKGERISSLYLESGKKYFEGTPQEILKNLTISLG